MGFLDNLKDRASELGEKAKEGFGSAKDHAADFTDDVRDRFGGGDDTPAETVDTQDVSPGLDVPTGAVTATEDIAGVPEMSQPYGDANLDDVLGTVEDRRPDPDPI